MITFGFIFLTVLNKSFVDKNLFTAFSRGFLIFFWISVSVTRVFSDSISSYILTPNTVNLIRKFFSLDLQTWGRNYDNHSHYCKIWSVRIVYLLSSQRLCDCAIYCWPKKYYKATRFFSLKKATDVNPLGPSDFKRLFHINWHK